MLSKVHYYDDVKNSMTNETVLNFNETNKFYGFISHLNKKLTIISPFEILICIWVFSLFVEEYIQVNKLIILSLILKMKVSRL